MYLTDGDYDVIHNELIEQYTTDYDGEVIKVDSRLSKIDFDKSVDFDGSMSKEYIEVMPSSKVYIENASIENANNTQIKVYSYDENMNELANDGRWCNDFSESNCIWTHKNAKYIKIGLTMPGTFTLVYNGVNRRTPNTIPSSADGSLIFSMYAPSNTVAPASGTWDLKGLEFDNFHTFGMNNDMKSEYILEYTQNKDLVLFENFGYSYAIMHNGSINGSYHSIPYIKVNEKRKELQEDNIK